MHNQLLQTVDWFPVCYYGNIWWIKYTKLLNWLLWYLSYRDSNLWLVSHVWEACQWWSLSLTDSWNSTQKRRNSSHSRCVPNGLLFWVIVLVCYLYSVCVSVWLSLCCDIYSLHYDTVHYSAFTVYSCRWIYCMLQIREL